MRKGWEIKRLGDVCTLQRGFDLPTHSRKSGIHPLVSSNGITDRINEWKIKAPGVVTGRSGSIGNIHFIEEDYWPLNTALYVKDFHGNYPRYVYYLLTQFDIGRFTSGAGVPTLNRNHVHDEKVFVSTTLSEQKRIVEILDKAFAAIDKAKAAIEKNLQNAKELFERYLENVFSNKGEQWVEEPLNVICEFKSGTTIPQSLERSEGDILYVKVGDMNLPLNKIEINTSSRFASSKEIRPNQIIPRGSIVFPKRGGAIATNKKRKIVKPTVVDLNTMAIIPSKKLLSNFFYYWFSLIDLNKLSNGTSIPQINNYSFNDLLVAYPISLTQQEIIVDTLDNIFNETKKLQERYQQKLTNLDELKKSILLKAFNGELTAATKTLLL